MADQSRGAPPMSPQHVFGSGPPAEAGNQQQPPAAADPDLQDYARMTFEQRRAAQDAIAARRRGEAAK
jgi:hypothetical protein